MCDFTSLTFLESMKLNKNNFIPRNIARNTAQKEMLLQPATKKTRKFSFKVEPLLFSDL